MDFNLISKKIMKLLIKMYLSLTYSKLVKNSYNNSYYVS